MLNKSLAAPFSYAGTVQAVRPSAAMLADCEPSQALDALTSEPQALAAYDKLPVQVRNSIVLVVGWKQSHLNVVGLSQISHCAVKEWKAWRARWGCWGQGRRL